MKLNKSGRVLNKNEKILIGVLAIVAIGVLIYMFIIQPSNEKLKPLKDEVSKLQQEVKDLEYIQVGIEKKESQLKDLQVEYDEASKTIPKTDRYPQLSQDLLKRARESGLIVEGTKYGKPKILGKEQKNQTNKEQKQGLSTFVVTIDVKGNYNQVMAYVKSIESDPRISEITLLSIDKEETTIGIAYYIAGGMEEEKYDFDEGKSYGKTNLFE